MKGTSSDTEIGDRVRIVRECVLHTNQDEFARMIGINSKSTIGRIESGLQKLDVATLQVISEAGGVDTNWILTGVGVDPRQSELPSKAQIDTLSFDGVWLKSRYGLGGRGHRIDTLSNRIMYAGNSKERPSCC